MSIRLSTGEFAALVVRAIASIPDSLSSYLSNVVVDVEPTPDAEVCRAMEVDDPEELLGLYLGTPLTERGIEAEPALPDRIVIYQRNVEAVCDSSEDIVEEVRLTVLHEIGHHFGLDEDELAELGYE